MELRQLRYFATVARELSFTRASAKLRIAQPALSRQIQQLEHELGVKLLHRDHRRVSLTDRGSSFLVEALALLQQAELALAHVRSGKVVTLNVGYVWGLFHSMAPIVLHRFRSQQPGIAINLLDLSAIQQSNALSTGRLDFGFIGLPFEAQAADLESQKIGICEFMLVLPKNHPLARRSVLPISVLKNEMLLAISEEHFPGASKLVKKACELENFKPRILQVVDRGHTLLGLVAAGCGVAVLPETLRELPHPGVVFRKLVQPVTSDLHIAWRRGLDPIYVQQFVQCCTHPH